LDQQTIYLGKLIHFEYVAMDITLDIVSTCFNWVCIFARDGQSFALYSFFGGTKC